MPRPVVFDYDAGSEETIVTAGIEGAQMTWIGINPITRPDGTTPFMHLLFIEGVLNPAGDAIETVTRGPSQVEIAGQDFTDFYVANKTVLDDFVRICLAKAAELKSKTGTIIEV